MNIAKKTLNTIKVANVISKIRAIQISGYVSTGKLFLKAVAEVLKESES